MPQAETSVHDLAGQFDRIVQNAPPPPPSFFQRLSYTFLNAENLLIMGILVGGLSLFIALFLFMSKDQIIERQRLWRYFIFLVYAVCLNCINILFMIDQASKFSHGATHGEVVIFNSVIVILFEIIVFAIVYAQTGLLVSSPNKKTFDLRDCFYFSVVTWTTLGYGDIIPFNQKGRIAVAIEALSGYLTMAAFAAEAIALLAPPHN